MQRRHSIFRKAKKSQNILWAPARGLIFHLPWIRCQSAIILTNATNAANLNIYSTSHQADMGKHENKQWGNEKCTDCNHSCCSDSSHIQATFENQHRVKSGVKTGPLGIKKECNSFCTKMNDFR